MQNVLELKCLDQFLNIFDLYNEIMESLVIFGIY